MAVYSNASTLYGFEQGLVIGAPYPIVAKRAPTNNDRAEIGTMWIYTTNNAVYVLTSIVAGAANWAANAGAGEILTAITVTTGPNSISGTTSINTTTAAATNIGTGGTGVVNIGNVAGNTAVTGTLTTSAGITATTGNIVATAGNISTTAGSITSHTTLTAGTGITATTGNIAATAGAVTAGTTVTGGTGVTATTGNITATAGNLVAGGATGAVVFSTSTLKIVSGTGDPNTAVTAPQGSLYLRTDGSGTTNRAYINTNSGTAWTAITTAA